MELLIYFADLYQCISTCNTPPGDVWYGGFYQKSTDKQFAGIDKFLH